MDESKQKTGNSTSRRVQTREKRSRNEMETVDSVDGSAVAPAASTVAQISRSNNKPHVPPTSASAAEARFTVVRGAMAMPQESQEQIMVQARERLYSRKTAYDVKSSQSRFVSTMSGASFEPPPPVPVPDQSTWKDKIMPHISRCTSAEGIRESSFFAKTSPISSSATSRNSCLRRLLQELVALEEDLPDTLPGIWLRYDEECPQFLRCLMAAPQGTPYALGLFCFDMWIPDSYPSQPPKMQLLTTGAGSVRFSPNLYADGKVCLSLLGTWSGPKWNPLHSSILQVLMSIQGLILGVQNPYYLEPGHGGWEGQVKSNPITTTTTNTQKKESTGSNGPAGNALGGSSSEAAIPGGATVVNTKMSVKEDGTTETVFTTIPVVDSSQPMHVQHYEDKLRMGTLKYAMLDMLRNAKNENLPPRHYLHPFKDIILCHLYHCKASIIPTATIFAAAVKSSTQRRSVKTMADELEKTLKELAKPSIIEMAEAATEKSSGTGAAGDTKLSATAGKKAEGDVETIMTAKRLSLQEAVAKEDYTTAARLQQELHYLGDAALTTHCSIEQRILAKTQAMEAAAEAKDYITAGQHQASLQRLTKNKRVLQNLEHRMFDAASKLDYVRAGNFQTQYKLLLEQSESANGSARSLAKESSYKGDFKSNSFPTIFPPSFATVAEAAASSASKMGSAKMTMSAPFISISPPNAAMAGMIPAPPSDGFYDEGYHYPEDGYYNDGFFADY